MLMRVGLTVSAGAALAAGGAAQASAQPQPPTATLGRTDLGAALMGTRIGLEKSVEGLSPVIKTFKFNPLAATPVDPLNNGARTQVADFKPVGTDMLTSPLTKRGQLGDLPVVGQVLGALPGANAPAGADGTGRVGPLGNNSIGPLSTGDAPQGQGPGQGPGQGQGEGQDQGQGPALFGPPGKGLIG
ncbi:hypothetical protein [Streptomyces sp. NPDC049585]|uniref:hypothetical protein n=1 Tax=Streptomyces sp. NPDC049585 TaxID=3155154 RepID=UPI0034135877